MGERATSSPWRFRFLRRFAGALLRMEYRRIEVAGAEHVPLEGAAVLVANHQNSLVDSLAILSACPRPAGPLAKAPLFQIAMLAPFLKALGAIPVFRPQDTEENAGQGARANLPMMAECSRRLAAGGAIVLFPEGVSQPAPKLMPLRTGAARIALDAAVPVALVPVALTYDPPAARRGTILVAFGAPFQIDGRDLGPRRRGAIADTTRGIEGSLRALLAEADSQGDLATMRILKAVLEQERGAAAAPDLEGDHARLRRMAHGFHALSRIDLPELEAIRADSDAFGRHLSLVGVPLDLLDEPYPPARVIRFLVRTLVIVLFGAPVALLASLVTWPARTIGDVLLTRRSRVTEDVLAFNRIIGQAFVLAILTLVTATALAIWLSLWVGLAALVVVPLLFCLHVAWRDWKADVSRRIRTFTLLAGGRLRDDLHAQRRRLAERLEKARVRLEAVGIDLDAPPAPGVRSSPTP